MLKLLTCVQGHFWEVAQPSDNGDAPNAASFRCPVCGAPADELPLIDLAPSETSIEIPATPPPAPKPQPLLDTRGDPVVSGYEILEALGKNKKGVLVYRAKQVLINRIVLLKVVLSKDDVGQMAWGGLRGEANALARLVHPNIPQIHEVGERDRQLFYNVVELSEGVPLSQKMQGKPEAPLEAAKFVENLARAVHFAHEQGVVHRNLQPANIVVAAKANTPLSQWAFQIDGFGLAGRPVEGDINDIELQGKLPHHLSPEQAWGYAKDIGACSDVYALGVLLSELLVGKPPFRGERTSEIIEQIRSRPATPPRDVNPRVPTDLDAICRKCLQKPPRKRYASARELADDLRRYQSGEPIQAHDNGLGTRLFMWVRRRPALAVIVVLLGMMFVSTFIAFLIGLLQGEGDSEATRQALQNERLARLDADKFRAERDKTLEGEKLLTYYHDILRADADVNEDRFADALALLNPTPATHPVSFHLWEWHYLMNKANSNPPRPFQPGIKAIVSVALSPDGLSLAVAGSTADNTGHGVVYILDAFSGVQRQKIDVPIGSPQEVDFSPDGQSLAILSGRGPMNPNQGQLNVYNVAWQRGPYPTIFTIRATSVAYSPNGKYLAVSGLDGQPRLYGASDGVSVNLGGFSMPGFRNDLTTTRVAFSADSQRLAVSHGVLVAVLSVPQGDERGSLRDNGTVTTLSYAPDDRLATGSDNSTVTIWDGLPSVRHTLRYTFGTKVERVLFAADGKRLAVLTKKPDGNKQPVLHWYDGTSYREILTVTDLPNQINAIAMDKGGRRLAVATATDVRIYGATTNP